MEIEEFVLELKKININITQEQLNKLNKYYELLIKYNKVMNLTGITEKKEVYLKHFYDSLTINKIIDLNKINTMCDMGSGAGFPGLPIKILFPHIEVYLIDSLKKRVNFLNQVIEELELKKIYSIHTRIEDYSKINKEKFDLVTARAVAKTNILLELSMPMIKTNGIFVAMKANILDEITNIDITCNKLNCKMIDSKQFLLPNENSLRTLVKFKKIGKTNIIYPRKFEQIKKNPL